MAEGLKVATGGRKEDLGGGRCGAWPPLKPKLFEKILYIMF